MTDLLNQNPDFLSLCEEEILRLHRMIETWLNGTVPDSDEVFSGFCDALDEHFRMIPPSGSILSKQDICSSFRKAYGTHAGACTVKIEALRCLNHAQDYAMLMYHEIQKGSCANKRVSTVLFCKDRKTGKPKWLHLHETWIK